MAKDEQHNNSIDSESNDNSSSDDESETQEIESSTTDYEKQRQSRIAANNARMEYLGLRKIANSVMGTLPLSRKTQTSFRESKRVVKRKGNDDDDDDEYEPNCDDDNGDGFNSDSDSDEEDDFVEEEETFVRRNRKCNAKKVKNMKVKTGKQVSRSNPTDVSVFMDEDEALKQAIALSLKDLGQISDPQHGGSSQILNTQNASIKKKSSDQLQGDNSKTRKRKIFTSRVQMTEDDLVIHFCQIDEVGKGSITVRDVQRMAATHDFTWTDEEISDMICCFDSDRNGKLTLDDFRNIAQRCNMLQAHADS